MLGSYEGLYWVQVSHRIYFSYKIAGTEATMQGVVGAAFEGAGVAIGSLLGGAVYKVKVTFTFLVLEISL